MKTSSVVWIIVVIVIILGGAWYWFANNTSTANSLAPASTATQAPNIPAGTTTPATAPLLSTSSNVSLGTILVASNGMTLYTYSPDTAGVSTCTGQCAANWPPYTVSAGEALAAAAGIEGSLGTTVRADGTAQLTYNGMPLYFYSKDTQPGDATGQNVGGVWFVATP